MLTWDRYDPGAFHNGFKGLCSVFVTAAFSFAGTELVGLCAAETDNPRKTLPTAVKQVFWRICLVSPQSVRPLSEAVFIQLINAVLYGLADNRWMPRAVQ